MDFSSLLTGTQIEMNGSAAVISEVRSVHKRDVSQRVPAQSPSLFGWEDHHDVDQKADAPGRRKLD